MTIFVVNKTVIFKALKFLKASVKPKDKKSLKIICEITVLDGKIQLAIPGSYHELNCKTQGVAKATIPFFHFFELIKDEKSREISIELKNNFLYLRGLKIPLNTCFIENDKILRTINLPTNYSDIDLVKLPSQGYTFEELNFNRLIPSIIQAQEEVNNKVTKAYDILSSFGFTQKEVIKLISEKAKIDIDKFVKYD